jgi:hypothetical protein
MGDDPRLAAARAGQHEEGPVAGENGVTLRRVQIVEEVLQACRHRPIVPYRMRPVASRASHSGRGRVTESPPRPQGREISGFAAA